MKHEYAPTTFRGPDPTYVVSLKYAAGSTQVKMSPQDIEKAIESIVAAAEQRGAAQERKDIVGSLIDWDVMYGYEEGTPETHEAHRIAAWIDNRADRITDALGDDDA